MPPSFADLVSVPELLRIHEHEHLYLHAGGFKEASLEGSALPTSAHFHHLISKENS